MALASVGFSFSMTEFGLAMIALIAFGMFATYKFRQTPTGLSKRGALLWRLAPTIGLGGGVIGTVILFGILNAIEHHWHTYSWSFPLGIFVCVGLSLGLRRVVEKRVH
jgi:hypothetical protein